MLSGPVVRAGPDPALPAWSLGHSEMPTLLVPFQTMWSFFLGYFSIRILPKFNFQMEMLVFLLTSPLLYTIIMKGNKKGHYYYFHLTPKRIVTLNQRLKGLFPYVTRIPAKTTPSPKTPPGTGKKHVLWSPGLSLKALTVHSPCQLIGAYSLLSTRMVVFFLIFSTIF